MNKILLFALLFSNFLFSQDTIITFRKKRIVSNNIEILDKHINYKVNNSSKNIKSVRKEDVFEIRTFDRKTIDFFTETEKSQSLDSIKKNIVNLINEFGFDEDSNKKKYFASFEGDYLRLQIKNAKGTKINRGFLFDFKRVIAFHELSLRNQVISFINIYIHFLDEDKKTEIWAKQKLIMKVKGHDEGNKILHELKLLNRVLLNKRVKM